MSDSDKIRAEFEKWAREAIFIEWENGELLAEEVERLRAELAAAKAASVVPVNVISVWADGTGFGRVTAYCKTLDDAMQFESWLLDRIKDTTPPAT